MRTLLDEIADATGSGPVITHEQHDPRRINWTAGLSDPGEMIGCGRYQELRRLANEDDGTYQRRLEALLPTLPAADREKIESAMIGAANARAGYDLSNGRVNVVAVGDVPWAGLGVTVRDALNSRDAARLGGLNWTARKDQLYYRDPLTGTMELMPDAYGVFRLDTGKPLGRVGNKYEVIQQADGFAFVDGLADRLNAQYESAGSLYGGAKVFITVRMPSLDFKVGAVDWQEAFGVFTNAHDGTEAGRFIPSSKRVICANSRRIAIRGAKGKGFSFRHTKNVAQAMAEVAKAYKQTASGYEQYAEEAEAMARVQIEPVTYFDGLLDQIADVTAAEANKGADALAAMVAVDAADRIVKRKQIERQIENRRSLLDEMIEIHESETCGAGGIRGTAWALYNAADQAAEHGKLGGRFVGDAEKKQSSRFDSITVGRADDMKQIAYAQALAYAK